MLATVQYKCQKYVIDLSKPLDISIPIDVSKKNINAWGLDEPKIFPVKTDHWIGNVSKGASVNFNTILFNPHSHITHTECVGHITKNIHSVNKNLHQFFFLAELISITPKQIDNDSVITKKQLQVALKNKKPKAVVIRTLPNYEDKKSKQYSNTNPTYLNEDSAIFLRKKGVEHLLIDLPSVDKEKDNGELLAHNAFWNTAKNIRLETTITEFIYVSNKIKDGSYFLNLMVAPFENDATPSKPMLYKIIN